MSNLPTGLTTVRRYPKTVASIGILTTAGYILYKRKAIQSLMSREPNISEGEKSKKRPDYIYIKYHIYKESVRKQRLKEEENKKWVNIIINPVGKWWKTLKHSVAWRLLNIAQNGSQHERLKAVHQLSRIDHLKDWDFRHLAQICDARTAVSLARSGADVRWFLPPVMRGCIKNPKIMLSELRDLLAKLRPNKCVDNFFWKYFPQQDPTDIIDEFFTHDQPMTLNVQDTDLLKEIISFLHHITKDAKISERIINDGGLVHMMELSKIFADDNETLATLCKVLANMSMVDNNATHFFSSGWIRVLAEWQQCPDLRLQVISAKAMANLDHDDPNHFYYPPNVYPLHPRMRTRRKPKADIVFIHGLLGGVFITWRQKDPKPMELGLYGKNAFYTTETDDAFLVGDHSRWGNGKSKNSTEQQEKKSKEDKNGNGQQQGDNGEEVTRKENPCAPKKDQTYKNSKVLSTAKKSSKKTIKISDSATMELLETLRNEAELDKDWEVVHPDVPLKANENCLGEFSVSGNKWKNQDSVDDYTNCWPMEWLPDDFPNARIIGIDYTSAVTEWSANFTKYCPCEKGQGHIETRAISLLERISTADVGNNRPVVWVGHSMGGLLTKIMLMRALQDPSPSVHQIAKNTSGIVFLGTPHRGSPIAKWKQHMQVILSPSIEVKEMEEGSPRLLALHTRFMDCLNTYFRNVKIVTIAEGTPTMLTTFKFPLRIVTEDSARIDHGDFYILKDDHLSLSKPIFRQSFLYQRVLQLIDESIKESKNEEDKIQLADTELRIQTVKRATNEHLAQNTYKKSIFSLFPYIALKLPTIDA